MHCKSLWIKASDKCVHLNLTQHRSKGFELYNKKKDKIEQEESKLVLEAVFALVHCVINKRKQIEYTKIKEARVFLFY